MSFLKKQIENDWDISLDWRWAFEARQDSIWYARLHVICKFACDMQDCILYARLHLICKITFDIQDCIWYARLHFICKIKMGKVLTKTTKTPVVFKTFRILLTVNKYLINSDKFDQSWPIWPTWPNWPPWPTWPSYISLKTIGRLKFNFPCVPMNQMGKMLTKTTTLTPVIFKTFRILLTVKKFGCREDFD